MACTAQRTPEQTLEDRMREVEQALRDLQQRLGQGLVKVVVGRNGAVSFQGWSEVDRKGLTDACTVRSLQVAGSWQFRQALARAEALAGRKMDATAVAAGWHSHDEGKTWAKH